MGRRTNRSKRYEPKDYSALEAALQRSWQARKSRETRRERSFYYIGRTVIDSESVIEELSLANPSSIIQANGQLVIPLMNRKALRSGSSKELLEDGVEHLTGLGATDMEVKLGDPFPKKQVNRNPNTGRQPYALRVALIDGREEIEREQMIVANYLGRDTAGLPVPDLRVAEAFDLQTASDVCRVIRQSLPPVVTLSSPAVLELSA